MRSPLLLSLVLLRAAALPAEQLHIVCSVPDLADLVAQVGGDAVQVDALVRPRDNPHVLSARPSHVRMVAGADALVVVGLDLEVGWVPALLRGSRNQRVQPGRDGYIDCSAAITPLGVASEVLDRSHGDVHPHGNPHYLLSPRCGIEVLRFLGERLAAIDAQRAATYRERAGLAAASLARSLYGEAAVAAHPLDDLLRWHASGTLPEHVAEVGGWLQDLGPLAGMALIDDHDQWPYLVACYGLRIVGHLEPKAGIPPSSGHLQDLIGLVRASEVRAVITAPWFDPRHARTVAGASGIPVIPLAHQVGSQADCATYQELCASNAAALMELAAQ